MQLMADYHNVIYFKALGALYLNLFVLSEVAWSHDGRSVKLRQETAYPEAETTTLHVELWRPARFPLKLRLPGRRCTECNCRRAVASRGFAPCVTQAKPSRDAHRFEQRVVI